MRSRRLVPIALALGALLALMASGVVLAQGGDLNGKFLTGSDVTIPAGTVDHDVYAFAGRVTSDASINGELVAAGGTIVVNGVVSGDVIATGGQITINGTVGGHVRAAGGQITVNGPVTKDVLAAGGQLTIGSGSTVGGDLLATGGQLALDGKITGGAVGSVGAYSKNGSVGGQDQITINRDQRVGGPIFESNPVLDAIRHFVAVVLIGLLALWLWPRATRFAEAAVRERPLPSFGWGIVSFIGYFVVAILIVIVAVILAFVLGALGFGALLGLDLFGSFVALGGLTLAFIVALAFLSYAVVGMGLARAVLGRTGTGSGPGTASTPAEPGSPTYAGWAGRTDGGARTDRWSDVLPLVVGAAVVVILTSIPVVGPLIALIVALLGLGAIVLAVWRRPIVPVVAPPPPPAAA